MGGMQKEWGVTFEWRWLEWDEKIRFLLFCLLHGGCHGGLEGFGG